MGIGLHIVEALIRESQHRPINGDVILIGRQSVYFTPQDILAMLASHGIDVSWINPGDIKTGATTKINRPGLKAEELITDAELFRLIGVPKILALDHSDYEGAEIIHDLTKPVPPELENCADFILDGSTLDNVFDPAMVITNFSKMLRPGGRLLTTNMFSNHFEPYVIVPPLWYFDYFIMNRFVDCKVYIIVLGDGPDADASVFIPDIEALLDPAKRVTPFAASGKMTTIVLAEKGPHSTSHIRPVQQHYRSDTDWAAYRQNLATIKRNNRHHSVRTLHQNVFDLVKGGHLFIAEDFTARDPMTEIRRRQSAAE